MLSQNWDCTKVEGSRIGQVALSDCDDTLSAKYKKLIWETVHQQSFMLGRRCLACT